MHPIFLLIALVVGLVLLSRYRSAPAAKRKGIRDRTLLIGGALLLALMVVRGGMSPILALLGGGAALGFRLLQAAQLANSLRGHYNSWRTASAGPKPGQASAVRTRFIHMTLDHDSGEMAGVVVEGRFEGRQLGELDLAELRELHTETVPDPQSRAVLEAYIERVHGQSWGPSAHGQAAATRTTLSPQEAREVLGVTADATREEIVAAHRRLMQKLHPDRGGSTYLAAQINAAKQVLLDS